MTFENPANQFTESASFAFLWALIFGVLYFISKGVWRHVVLFLTIVAGVVSIAHLIGGGIAPDLEQAAALLAAAVVQIVYAFFAGPIVRRHYLRMGWSELI